MAKSRWVPMEIKNISIKIPQMADCYFDESSDGVRHIKSLPFLSVVQSVTGSYDIAIDDGEQFHTGRGGFFIAPSQITQDIIHHVDTDRKMQVRWIFLDVSINDSYLIDSLYDFPVILPKKEQEALNLLFDRLFGAKHICDRMSTCYQIVKLLLSVATEKPLKPRKELLEVLEYIKQNYQQNIQISDLAKIAKMSEANFYAVFRKYFNNSPISYINDYRLMIASGLLKNTQERIGMIAEQVGISDQLYFSKLFKRKYAVSPRVYQKNKDY